MKKVLTILFNIIVYLTALQMIYIAFYNGAQTVNVQILMQQCADQLNNLGLMHFNPIAVNAGFTTLTLSFFAVGLITGIVLLWQKYSTANERLKAYKRELEKNSVEKDSSTSRVDVLEAKIKVLEKALHDALNK